MTENPKPKRQRRNRFKAADIIYVRCAACGGKFDEKLVQMIEGKIICGMCKLIDIAWK